MSCSLALTLALCSPAALQAPAAQQGPAPVPRLARRAELAGEVLAGGAGFLPRRTYQETQPIAIAVDPAAFPDVAGKTARVHVVAARTPAQWLADRTLVDVTGAVEVVVLGDTLAGNVVIADAGTLAGGAGVALTAGYDVVVDLDGDGLLSPVDLLDGADGRPGLSVSRDPSLPGPFSITELTYNLSAAPWDEQNLFYPSQIASLGELPLVVLSHGNGQSYQWYEALGTHLASHGYLFLAHATNTGPGATAAGLSTISNTDAFLNSLSTIGGGVLDGHVDATRIAWMGVGRGGEGVVIAAEGLASGVYTPVAFGSSDVRALIAAAPSDSVGASPGSKPFTLIDGAAATEIGACFTETLHHLDRGDGPRRSFYVQGASSSHLYGSGPPTGAGPCPLAPADVQSLVGGYLVALLAHDLRGETGARDFLTRSWTAFRPLAAPSGPCATVQLAFADHSTGDLVIDDYQSAPALTLSSSGAAIATTLLELVEDRLDDPDLDLTPDEPMNAMTYAGPLDDSRGAVLAYADARFLAFDLPGAPLDARAFEALSFRACQRSRHPLTAAQLAPLDFTLYLEDAAGAAATVRLSTLSAPLAEPYQRDGCGTGAGWINVFETVRIPLSAFPTVDRSRLKRVTFAFGAPFGSPVGAIGLDDLELVIEN